MAEYNNRIAIDAIIYGITLSAKIVILANAPPENKLSTPKTPEHSLGIYIVNYIEINSRNRHISA
ncbi:hypothetical protein [Wolbachia endosymbiont of Atemnus politus]|uniref:hypothetical protein n=1 Tax=Wolbachia endosymbiont of Atemnus politus TaxID=2682840 RepID=UPI001FE65BBF|nr:hypothetical protein [Wolbachia endosymbiont of Atemnus politus]